MRYLPSTPFELVSSCLNFNTYDCNVTGACELYSIKSSRADKRLLRRIDKDLASRHDTILQRGATMLPSAQASLRATSPMVRLFDGTDSAFGPLREVTNRRTYALLIATLNASHEHYDFSNQLQAASFYLEPDHDHIAVEFGLALRRFRHLSVEGDFAVGGGFDPEGDTRDPYNNGIRGPRDRDSPIWGRHCWREIDKEMRLSGCEIFRFNCPSSEDPLCDDFGGIWAAHYFIYSRALRRIAYLYARAVSVTSSRDRQHPVCRSLTSTDGHEHGSGGGAAGAKRARIDDRQGAQKRARYWLGDRDPSLIEVCDHDDDDEAPLDDGFRWNRHPNGDLIGPMDYDEAKEEEDEDVFSDEGYGFDEEDEEDEQGKEDEKDEDVFSDQGCDLYDGDEEAEKEPEEEAEPGDDNDKEGDGEDGAA